MSLRYGMRLGRGIGVGGGGGILAFYIFFWILELSVVSIIKIGALLCNVSGWAIQSSLNKRTLGIKRQADLALAHRIAAQRVHQVEYLCAGRTNPPALWGVYLVEPSVGPSYAKCGPHPTTLKKVWLENRQGTVHELIVLPDKPMAVATVDLVTRGVFKIKPGAASIVSDFAQNGRPMLRCVLPNAVSVRT